MSDASGRTKSSTGRRGPEGAWSLGIGQVAGIPIRIHLTFFLLLAWLGFRDTGPARWSGLLYVVGVFACVVLHELGHSLVAQRHGITVSEIVLYPIGGVARMERMPGPRQELWIALAGPAVNLVIAGTIFVVLLATGQLVPLSQYTLGTGPWWQDMMVANLVLAAFNMVPAFPMDGGRVLRSLLALRLSEVRATEVAAGIGQSLAFVLGFLGLLGNPFLLFIAFFVYIGAGQEAAMHRSKALVEGLPVRAAMVTDYRVLTPAATLQEAADMLLQTAQQDFPVMHGEQLVGVLSRSHLLRGLAETGPTAYVAGAMDRDYQTAGPGDDLQDVAARMQSGQSPLVIVMEGDQMLGMVTLENLAELLAVRRLMQEAR